MHSIQINVPHSVYGNCDFFMPNVLSDWLTERGLKATMCGGNSWGTGYDENGVTNEETVYMVKNAAETDGLAFKIMFPKCTIHVSEQAIKD